ncbi:MAG: DoxX family membrane protein [Acidobacteriota bacterium]|nr:MAG: DoxX family membrane protein [Acidobacteriota bacterium]
MSEASKELSQNLPVRAFAMIMRVLIGWHFLYEGLVKAFDDRWSSGPYLMQSKWLFSDLFHGIAGSPALLRAVDLLTIALLLLVGIGLMLGLLTRISCFAGSALLLLFYVANPPFQSFQFGLAEGHYLGVNKTLIEMAALCLLGFFPREALIGLDRLLAFWSESKKAAIAASGTKAAVPIEDNSFSFGFAGLSSRREMLKNLTVVPVLGGFVLAALRRHGWRSYEEENLAGVDSTSQASIKTVSASSLDDLKALAPQGTLGDLKVSRLICGGNLISGFAHARDLIYVSPLLKSYFTDEKVMETLWLCESSGINTAILRTDEDTVRVLGKYWKRGGKIQWLAQTYPKIDDVKGNIDFALDNGAVGAFVQGNIADSFIKDGRLDLVEQAVDHIRSRGVPAGSAAHAISTVQAIEDAGLPTDFYMKTLHHNDYWSARRDNQQDDVITNKDDNYWEMTPEETIRYMESVGKPWIAYKVLAAGAIAPEDGFRFAFQNGADFACVGMFDFQIVDNVNTITGIFSGDWERRRPWMA